MNIAILGTGMVGRAHAEKLIGLGHQVAIGTRDINTTITNTTTDAMGTPPFSQWHQDNPTVKLLKFSDAAKFGEMIIESLHGAIAVDTLKSIETDIANKVLIDTANPLDFSHGMPPSLSICNTDSLGEQIQKAIPSAQVVKCFNTLNATLQTNPQLLTNSDHTIFISGNNPESKNKVTDLLKSYGWIDIVDLGDITTARSTEMLMPIWMNLWGSLKTPLFNFKIVRS